MAAQPSDPIREAFLPLIESPGNIADMPILTRHDSEGRLHCEVFVYFSPAAAEIAQAFEAKPCERPLRRCLDLLVGDKSC